MSIVKNVSLTTADKHSCVFVYFISNVKPPGTFKSHFVWFKLPNWQIISSRLSNFSEHTSCCSPEGFSIQFQSLLPLTTCNLASVGLRESGCWLLQTGLFVASPEGLNRVNEPLVHTILNLLNTNRF